MRLTALCGLLPILLLGSSAGVAAGDDGFDITRALHLSEKGMRALRADNLKKAERLFVKALEIVPQYPNALVGKGHIAMRNRRFVEALDSFESAEEGYRVLGDALFEVRLDAFNRAQKRIAGLRTRIQEIDQYLNRQANIRDSSNRGYTPPFTVSAFENEKTQIERELESLLLMRPPVQGGDDPVPGEIHFTSGTPCSTWDGWNRRSSLGSSAPKRSPTSPWCTTTWR